jgi:cytochrome bd-type quinol oxidase subunit 2
MEIAEMIVRATAIYALAGLLFATWFIAEGAGKLDPSARSTSLGFRLLILPGTVAMWPWLLVSSIRTIRSEVTR